MKMNSENIRGDFLEETLNLSTVNSNLNEKPNGFLKEKGKRALGVLKAKGKSKMALGPRTTYEQCFSGNNFTSQYEDECPVNYSLKYSETESYKGVNKCVTAEKKFKDYADYAETDLDQPTDFSLKYAEKTYDDENKSTTFNFFSNDKNKFKEYTDYVETDLDQPTDFTLKYRESVEEDVKNLEFNYYENEEQKASISFGPRTSSEDAPEKLPERYASQNETPLMFSRSSSMNSLSSFVHITQSIPDDRSSVVSDFSRMTSGIISPSELPDSPTQTAPSSPKRPKPPVAFSSKPDFLTKQSVFEDDVATYKQEGTPIEFSRATSLSSLNIDNPVKSDLVIKRNSTSLILSKEENSPSVDHVQSEHLKQQTANEKTEHDKGKFELASVLEVDESLFADCISIDIQINCRKPKPNYDKLVIPQKNNPHLRQSNGVPVKPNFRLRFHNDNRKGYATYEGSDDAVHTYHTEGTPANVSHAGSHSDLSALSIASGIPLSGIDDNSDNDSFFPEDTETVPMVKVETHKSSTKVFTGNKSIGGNRNVYVNNQPQLDYLRKDHQLTAKDETATFATENSPCDISIRSSLNDLTVNVMDVPLSINRTETCEELPSQMLSPLRNVSPQSPNSMVFEEGEDADKCPEEPQSEFISSEAVIQKNNDWSQSSGVEKKTENNSPVSKSTCSVTETVDSTNFDFDSSQPLTPFEEALVEECIRLGMPQKKKQKQLQETHFKLGDEDKASEKKKSERDEFSFSKTNFEKTKYSTGKKISSNSRSPGTDVSNTLNADNFDFDSSEPLTPFEEVLLEQCIRLGMPQKRNCKKVEGTHLNYLDGGTDSFDCDSAELITPLESALLEQCIRLGMPQRKSQRKEGNAPSEEPHKAMSCLTAHLNRLKLNSEIEKEKDAIKKCENCPCGKRHSNRRKNTSCKKSKNRLDHFKVESCPV